mmetsp:Transcript_21060/g.36145  ORF Transcript_21060/g.36145 Transcript_21060/m.36145 type:complete len:223 (+) Transcript_21060:252-920(+)
MCPPLAAWGDCMTRVTLGRRPPAPARPSIATRRRHACGVSGRSLGRRAEHTRNACVRAMFASWYRFVVQATTYFLLSCSGEERRTATNTVRPQSERDALAADPSTETERDASTFAQLLALARRLTSIPLKPIPARGEEREDVEELPEESPDIPRQKVLGADVASPRAWLSHRMACARAVTIVALSVLPYCVPSSALDRRVAEVRRSMEDTGDMGVRRWSVAL